MKWIFQECSESGSFANSDEAFKTDSRAEVERFFKDWAKQHNRVGADPKDASLLVFKRERGDYPDFIVKYGPRGGIIWERC